MRLKGNPALILPGGGARAAYQVGVLKALSAVVEGEALPFNSVAGISAGSINGFAIARRADNFAEGVEQLERIWADMHSADVFNMDYGALQAFLSKEAKPTSLLDNTPLRNLLARTLGEPGEIAKRIAEGHLTGFAVTASNYSTGEATTFFEAQSALSAWHTRRRDSIATEIGIEHLLASSALPILFPPERVGKEFFVDGSLRMTQPLSPAIKLGADRILVIGVRNESLPLADFSDVTPGIAEVAGYTLDSLFSENLNADVERMEQVNDLLKLIPIWRRRRTKKRRIQVMVVRPSEDLRTIAARFSVQLPRGIRLFLRTVGGWGHEWRMPSYLLFESGFAKALIDLGYRDGLKLRPAIEQFFND